MEKTVFHYWFGNISGYVWACHRTYELSPKRGERLKYMGFTTDNVGWPKKMNTGRLIHKPNAKFRKKQRRRFKQSANKMLAQSPTN